MTEFLPGLEPPKVIAARAKAAEKRLKELRAALAEAKEEEECHDGNLSLVEMYEAAGNEHRLDSTWWDSAMRYGALDRGHYWDHRNDGQWPIRARRWFRHLRFSCHAERYASRNAISELTEMIKEIEGEDAS